MDKYIFIKRKVLPKDYCENLIEEDPSEIKNYPPYIINRCLSGHLDCVMFANEMNKYSFHLPY